MRREVRTMLGVGATFLLPLMVLAVSTPLSGQLMDKKVYTFVMADQFEYAPNGLERPVTLDALAWIGGDYNRLWLKAQGDIATTESGGELELQSLYGRFIASYWDLQAGLRLDSRFGGAGDEVRAHVVVALEGLAPYWFVFEPALFVSQDGDVSARLAASYDLLFSQRLIVQPDIELNAAVQDVPEWGIASGLNDLELGVRARYEITREFAPYVGFSWITMIGATAELARSAGLPTSDARLVLGVRAWY